MLYIDFKSTLHTSQPAKNMGPVWAPNGYLYGSYMGNPYGTHEGFATRCHVGPTWANPYGNHMGTIWVQYGKNQSWYMGGKWDPYGANVSLPMWVQYVAQLRTPHRSFMGCPYNTHLPTPWAQCGSSVLSLLLRCRRFSC